jgi:hypothetical protein
LAVRHHLRFHRNVTNSSEINSHTLAGENFVQSAQNATGCTLSAYKTAFAYSSVNYKHWHVRMDGFLALGANRTILQTTKSARHAPRPMSQTMNADKPISKQEFHPGC